MRIWSWWPVVFIAAVVVAPGCTDPGVNGGALVPECEKNWNWAGYSQVDLVGWEGGQRDSLTFLTGPRESQNTAEFHDCQRFVVEPSISQSKTFTTGILSIFAVPKADSVYAHVTDPVYADSAALGLALPAAQIFARDAYPPLSIDVGFSCLYLHPGPASDDDWVAYLRYDGWAEQNCSDPVPISSLGTGADWRQLYVDRSRNEGADPTGYPVVARWIWYHDQQGDYQEYKMGVWCDQAWCEVGSMDTQVSTPSFAAAHVPQQDKNSKQFRVNGWFDEQILAGYNGSLFVSGIVGTLIPDPRLGSHTDATFSEGRWIPTAKVALTPLSGDPNTPNPFEQKLNLGLSVHGVGLNQISLCRGPWAGVCQENGAPEPIALHETQIHRDSFQWWAKVERRGGGQPVTEYFSVARCPYDFEVAGTARWRWLSNDPGIWMRCINGCCEMQGLH